MAETLEVRVASSTTPLCRRKLHRRGRCSTASPFPPSPRSPVLPLVGADGLPSPHRGRSAELTGDTPEASPSSKPPPLGAVGHGVPIPAAGRPLGAPPWPSLASPGRSSIVPVRGAEEKMIDTPAYVLLFFFRFMRTVFQPSRPAVDLGPPAAGLAQRRHARVRRARGPAAARAVFFPRSGFSFSCWADFRIPVTFEP